MAPGARVAGEGRDDDLLLPVSPNPSLKQEQFYNDIQRSDYYKTQPNTLKTNVFQSFHKTVHSQDYFSYHNSLLKSTSNELNEILNSNSKHARGLVVNLEGYLYRPCLQILDSKKLEHHLTQGPTFKIKFESTHLENFLSAFIFIINPSRCDALFKIKNVPLKPGLSSMESRAQLTQKKSHKLVLPKIKTIYNMIDEKNAEYIDDPSVFFFQFQNGLVKANSTLIEHLPETTLFTSHTQGQWDSFKKRFAGQGTFLYPDQVPFEETLEGDSTNEPKTLQVQKNVNYSNKGSKALKMGLVFKPSAKGYFRSKFRLEVFNGLSTEFILEGKGHARPERIQMNY